MIRRFMPESRALLLEELYADSNPHKEVYLKMAQAAAALVVSLMSS